MTITPQRLDEIEEANARLRAEGHPQEVREELCAALREAWRERDQRIALHDFAVNQRNTMFGEALKVIAEERDALAALVGEIKRAHRGCSIAPIPAPAALEALTRRIASEVAQSMAVALRGSHWRNADDMMEALKRTNAVVDEFERRAKGEE